MAKAQILRVMDRSPVRQLQADARWGTGFEALLALRVLNGGLAFDEFERGGDLCEVVSRGLPTTVITALERLRTQTGEHWSALLALAARVEPSCDVAGLLAVIEGVEPTELKLAMMRSDRGAPGSESSLSPDVFHAAAAGDHGAVEHLLQRAETGGWDTDIRPLLGIPATTLAALVFEAIRDLPQVCYLQGEDDLGLLERNAGKAQASLAGPEEVAAVIERLTYGVQYRQEPGVARVLLIPTLVHRPWTLIETFADTKLFCYPARSDSELSAPDAVLIGIYRALGDGTRLRLLRRLAAGSATMGRLSAELELAKSTVHEHLLSLRTAGLVRAIVGGGYEIEPELPDLNWLLKEFLGLEMRRECEGCGAGLDLDGVAYICSYECTFCESCAESRKRICPNCGGELVLRPRRNAAKAVRRVAMGSYKRARVPTSPGRRDGGGTR